MKISILVGTFAVGVAGYTHGGTDPLEEKISLDELDVSTALQMAPEIKRCEKEALKYKLINCVAALSDKYKVIIPNMDGHEIYGTWFVSSVVDLMTDQISMIAFAEIEISEGVMALHTRCEAGKTEVFVSWPSTAAMPEKEGEVEVRYRIGSKAPVAETWRMASVTDNVAFYNGDSVELMRELAGDDKFAIEVVSGNGIRAKAFDIAGMNEFLPQFQKECEWD